MLLPVKITTKFCKNLRNLRFETLSAHFRQIRISMEEPLLSFFSVSRFVSLSKISEITNKFREKVVTDVFTDERTDRQE